MAPEPVHVLITGAAGQIGYALAPQVCRGAMLGPDVPVVLHLLDIPPAETALQGVAMELVDAAYPLLKGIVATVNVAEACKGVDVAVMGRDRATWGEQRDGRSIVTFNIFFCLLPHERTSKSCPRRVRSRRAESPSPPPPTMFLNLGYHIHRGSILDRPSSRWAVSLAGLAWSVRR